MFVWLDYYSRLLNIPRDEYGCMPFGEMADMMNCYRIQHGQITAKKQLGGGFTSPLDSKMIPDLI